MEITKYARYDSLTKLNIQICHKQHHVGFVKVFEQYDTYTNRYTGSNEQCIDYRSARR